MKTLFLIHYLPFPLDNGGAIAHSSMIEALSMETDVHLFILTGTPHSQKQVKTAQNYYCRFCSKFTFNCDPGVRPSHRKLIIAWHYLTGNPHKGGYSAARIESIRRLIEAEHIDAMWVGSPYAGKYLAAAEGIACKRVLMTHNVESDIIKQEIHNGSVVDHVRKLLIWRDVKKLEEQVTAMADVVTAITGHDAEYYRKLEPPQKVFLFPFALSPGNMNFQPKENSLNRDPDICFIGSMDWMPNEDAAYYLVNEILPKVWVRQPEAIVYIVGKNPSERIIALASEKVVITGRVVSVREYLTRAKVIVSPIRKGSGIKIKLIQAMAAGKAIVTTTMGAQGTGMRHANHALICDEPDDIADAIVALIGNEKKRFQLGEAARKLVATHFSMQRCREHVRKIVKHLEDTP